MKVIVESRGHRDWNKSEFDRADTVEFEGNLDIVATYVLGGNLIVIIDGVNWEAGRKWRKGSAEPTSVITVREGERGI